ncbi:Asparagine--tRNA ligase [Citrus sinensis]|uniref:Asparagine--tRNA ligase n=1 Tax=Citrus sinensis TaxID=2711 RepID=A0ACB8LUZ4_CITSI|nr:Asparagine--tRNA ligase [Citrus sinensis]
MATAFVPSTTLRLRPYSTLRCLSFYPKNLTKPYPVFPPLIRRSPISPRRFFSSVISGALHSGERTKSELAEKQKGQMGSKVGEFRKKLKIVDVKGGPDEGLDRVGLMIVVAGWVRTLRAQSSVTFIEVNDGSCLSNMQCVMTSDAEGYDQVKSGLITTGASIWIQGNVVPSQGSKQKVELKVNKIVLVGKSDPSYPIQKKRVSREFLRTKAHLRPRTNTFGAVARVRNALAYATHKFFQENGFIWISSPIITASDCEGAGEQFCVTTLIPSSREAVESPVDAIPKTKDGLIDWSQVYTFGPTFRAENSNTSRHLAEFWMIEPELAFADLKDDMACATAYLQYVTVAERDFVQLSYTDAIELLIKAKKKFEFLCKNNLPYLDLCLWHVRCSSFRLRSLIIFQDVKWGCDLQSEHERYLTEEAFGGCPVIVSDYPKEIKAFYMRQNDDGRTVAAMDMLVPRIGELIGGSQREERLEYLEGRLDELKLNRDTYWWYLDLRHYGSVPHAGFGLGFERLVQFATGVENIRDAIPFPRTPGSAEF